MFFDICQILCKKIEKMVDCWFYASIDDYPFPLHLGRKTPIYYIAWYVYTNFMCINPSYVPLYFLIYPAHRRCKCSHYNTNIWHSSFL